MPWIDAFAPAEAHYKAKLDQATWGHLAPKKNISYKGIIRFAVGIFGSDDLNPVVIQCDLKGRKEELSSSPWFYDALAELLSEWATDGHYGAAPELPADWPKVESGGVYEWSGTFRNYEFDGTLRRLSLA